MIEYNSLAYRRLQQMRQIEKMIERVREYINRPISAVLDERMIKGELSQLALVAEALEKLE